MILSKINQYLKDGIQSIVFWWDYDIPPFINAVFTSIFICVIQLIIILISIIIVILLMKIFHVETILQLIRL